MLVRGRIIPLHHSEYDAELIMRIWHLLDKCSYQFRRKIILQYLIPLIGIIAITILLQIAWIPGNRTLGNDSGLFAYIGRQILAGGRLYIDVFDHKTPGIYYINALAFTLFGDSMWSIWILGTIWLSLAASLLYLVLHTKVHTIPAFLAVQVFLYSVHYPEYYQGGNLTEVYVLLPQVLMITATAAYSHSRKQVWLLLLGFFAGLSVLLKPTFFGIGLAVALVLLFQDISMRTWKEAFSNGIRVLVGLFLPLGIVISLSLANQTFRDLWYATAVFNFQYSNPAASLQSIYGVLRKLFIVPPLSYMNVIALGGAVSIFLSYIWKMGRSDTDVSYTYRNSKNLHKGLEKDPFFFCMLIALLIEWGLLFISGRSYGHYFITTFSTMSVCVAYLMDSFPIILSGIRTKDLASGVLGMVVVALFLMWGIEVSIKNLPSGTEIQNFIRGDINRDYRLEPVVQYIVENTDPQDPIYIWDDHAEMYYLSNRQSQSRFLYATHLLIPGVDHDDHFSILLSELNDEPPSLILTQPNSGVGVPYLGASIEDVCRAVSSGVCPGIQELRSFLEDNYEFSAEVGTWHVYSRVNPLP